MQGVHAMGLLSEAFVATSELRRNLTQFEIEFRSGGHSVTKKFLIVLQVLCKNLNYRNVYIFLGNMFSMKKSSLSW